MEILAVVEVSQVAEFMQHYQSKKFLRKKYQRYIQVNIVFRGATAPVGPVVLKEKPVILEAVFLRKGSHASWQHRGRFLPHRQEPGLFRLRRRTPAPSSEYPENIHPLSFF